MDISIKLFNIEDLQIINIFKDKYFYLFMQEVLQINYLGHIYTHINYLQNKLII